MCVDTHISQGAFELGQALFGGHVCAAEALAAGFCDRMQRRVLQ